MPELISLTTTHIKWIFSDCIANCSIKWWTGEPGLLRILNKCFDVDDFSRVDGSLKVARTCLVILYLSCGVGEIE